MPDHHAQAKAAYAEHLRDLDLPKTAHLAAQAIADCGLCDADGYRGSVVCDHVDRTETVKHGQAMCREALAAKQLKLGDGER